MAENARRHEQVVTQKMFRVIVGIDDSIGPARTQGIDLGLPPLSVGREHGRIHKNWTTVTGNQAAVATCKLGLDIHALRELNHDVVSPSITLCFLSSMNSWAS